MVLTIPERVFLVDYVFLEANSYTDFVWEKFVENFPEAKNEWRHDSTPLMPSACPK
jgi:hypothetical protein